MRKVSAFFVLASVFIGLSFISCDNFLTGSDVRDQLEKQIDYANAPSYKITIEYPKKSGVVKSPSGGEAQKKVTDVFTVCFEPFSDYEFITWKIIDSVTKKEYHNGEYLKLESLEDAETTCTFVNAPENSVHLCLYAEVALRPYILSKTPLYSATRSLRDATIQVMFDQKMDEGSIYFDGEEIGELQKLYNLTENDFEYIHPDTKKKCWCYKYNGNTYFKNITITNYKTNEILNHCFNAPILNNYILTITADPTNPPKSFSQILVTIEKDFYYKVGKKNVAMDRSEKWNYQVNDKTDKLPPSITDYGCKVGFSQETDANDKFIVKDLLTAASSQPSDSSIKFIQNKKIYLDFEVQDDDGTIPSTFSLILKKLKDASYENVTGSKPDEIAVEYLSAGGNEGKFYGPVELEDIEDGIYSMYLQFKDASNHSCTYPKKQDDDDTEPPSKLYFCLDTSVPKPEIDYSNTTNSITIIESSRPSDFKQATVKYKEQNEQNYHVKENVKDNPIVISDLTAASNYEIELTYEDKAGNKNTSDILYAKTQIEAPVLVKPATEDYNIDNSITVTWETVDTNWKKISLFAGTQETVVTDAPYQTNNGKRQYTYTLTNLDVSTKYSIKVKIWKERPDGSVDDSVSTAKYYCTRPDTPILKDVTKKWNSNSSKWQATIEWDYSDFNNGEYYYKPYEGSETKITSSDKSFVINGPTSFSIDSNTTSNCGKKSYTLIKRLQDDWNYSYESESSSKTAYYYPDVSLDSITITDDPKCSFLISYSDGPTPTPAGLAMIRRIKYNNKVIIDNLMTNVGNLYNAAPGMKVVLEYLTPDEIKLGESLYYLPDANSFYTLPGLIRAALWGSVTDSIDIKLMWADGANSNCAESIYINVEDPKSRTPVQTFILPTTTTVFTYEERHNDTRNVKITVYTTNVHYDKRIAVHGGGNVSGGDQITVRYSY